MGATTCRESTCAVFVTASCRRPSTASSWRQHGHRQQQWPPTSSAGGGQHQHVRPRPPRHPQVSFHTGARPQRAGVCPAPLRPCDGRYSPPDRLHCTGTYLHVTMPTWFARLLACASARIHHICACTHAPVHGSSPPPTWAPLFLLPSGLPARPPARLPGRPAYHVMPACGWGSDPCAPFFWRGRYHLWVDVRAGAGNSGTSRPPLSPETWRPYCGASSCTCLSVTHTCARVQGASLLWARTRVQMQMRGCDECACGVAVQVLSGAARHLPVVLGHLLGPRGQVGRGPGFGLTGWGGGHAGSIGITRAPMRCGRTVAEQPCCDTQLSTHMHARQVCTIACVHDVNPMTRAMTAHHHSRRPCPDPGCAQ